MTGLLLDTCACIWISEDAPLSELAVDALNEAWRTGNDVRISPLTAWEIGMLMARGRLTSRLSPRAWFHRLAGVDGVALAELSPDILLESNALPGEPPRDPADRIIIATAREIGLTIVTRDKLILDYADQGHVLALAC
ncbi:MAG: type II toxin-antitoxin system VapC family toxin [Asticcacaulis sp.]|nr:type II toxin-antitoxin system VapC family toxin [Asticcacaulis sp.]